MVDDRRLGAGRTYHLSYLRYSARRSRNKRDQDKRTIGVLNMDDKTVARIYMVCVTLTFLAAFFSFKALHEAYEEAAKKPYYCYDAVYNYREC